MTEPNELTIGGGAIPGRGHKRAITAAMVTAAMLSAQAAFAGYAGAQEAPSPSPNPPAPAPSPSPNPPAPPPPPAPAPDNGGGAGGGGAFVPGTFIQLGTGFPFSGTTTVDYGAFPVGGFEGGFTVSPQPPGVTVDPVSIPSTDGLIDSTFEQAGLE